MWSQSLHWAKHRMHPIVWRLWMQMYRWLCGNPGHLHWWVLLTNKVVHIISSWSLSCFWNSLETSILNSGSMNWEIPLIMEFACFPTLIIKKGYHTYPRLCIHQTYMRYAHVIAIDKSVDFIVMMCVKWRIKILPLPLCTLQGLLYT